MVTHLYGILGVILDRTFGNIIRMLRVIRLPKEERGHLSWTFVGTLAVILAYGLIMMFSASYARAYQEKGTSTYYFARQAVFAVLGIAGMLFVSRLNYQMWRFASFIVLGVSVFFLLLVPFIGEASHGAKRWITVAGIRFQPSELAKLALIITLSKALTRYPDRPIPNFRYFVYICMHFGIPALLIAAQPDIGTLMVFCIIFIALLFVSGFELKWMFLLGGIVAAGITPIIFYLASTNNFRWLRLVAFINPESDPTGSSYQIVNSKITIGSGGLYGKGAWAEGTLTHLNYVPENHTDFIFSVVGETLGFFGSLVLLALYAFVIYRMLVLAFHTNDKFGQLIIIGVMAMLVFHVYENIGMCIGVMPITGIPLPFISYGGTNLVVNMAGVGLVLNVTQHKSSVDLKTKRS